MTSPLRGQDAALFTSIVVGLRGCHGPSTPRAAHKKRAKEKAARSGRDDRSTGHGCKMVAATRGLNDDADY